MVRDESRYIEEKIDESTQASNSSLGIVRKVFEHDSTSDNSNHEVNVELVNGDEEFRRVPVHVDRMGHARVPQEGDFVEVSFLSSQTQRPYVSGFAYSSQQRAPLARAGHWRQEFGGCDSGHLYVEAETSDHSAGEPDIIRFAKKPDGLSDPTAEITLDCSGTGVDISLSGDDISVTADDNVSVDAGSDMTLTAGNSVTIEENGSSAIGIEVEENGSLVVDPATGINFGENINVFDDGDGTVTVNTSRVDAEDNGTVVEQSVDAINFGSNLDVTNDNDGSVTVDSGFGPETIADYASYWNAADDLIAADDASSRVVKLTSQVLDSNDITASAAANLLANDVFPVLSTPEIESSVVNLYSTAGTGSQLSASKGESIAREGTFTDPAKYTATFYGISGESSQILSASTVASLIEDGLGQTDSFIAEATAPYDADISGGFRSDYWINDSEYGRLNDILSNVVGSRVRTLYQTGSIDNYPNLEDQTGWLYGIWLTSYPAADAATDLDTSYYPNSEVKRATEYLVKATNKSFYTADEWASVINNSNLSPSRAVEVFGNGSSNSDDGRALTFGSSNFGTSRAAALWNEYEINSSIAINDTWQQIINNGDNVKLASSIDDANLTETNAESIWNSASFGNSDAASVTSNLTDVEKPLTFGEQWYHLTTNSPDSNPRAIGGDSSTIWNCDNGVDKVYELDTADFSVIRSSSAPSTDPQGIGGDSNTIWHSDADSDKVYELDTADFSVIRSSSAPSTDTQGIGGDSNTIWYSDLNTEKVYELDTADFSVIRSSSSPTTGTLGIGGDGNNIYHVEFDTDSAYELDTADFSVIRNNPAPDSLPTGIGGDGTFIWHTDNVSANIYRLAEDS